ncbi:MAG: DUF1302 family protein [Thermodesulfobacteriota bacterium]
MVDSHKKRWTCVSLLTTLLVSAGLVWFPPLAGATIRVGNSEIQLVYEQQHAFQFDNAESQFEWVQWRNELRVEYQYEDLVTESRLFDQIHIPFINRADFSLIYRGRFDPVYIVRDKYDKLYYDDQTRRFAIPENDIREINLDVDFGQVFGRKLSMRLGKQQIVWGESDLFRSIDIVNPLRVDQNGFVGEAFEDFRTPIWAVKFLYDIGNIGTIMSNVGWETFYTPMWRPFTNHLILEGSWELQYRNPRLYRDAPDGINFINRLGNFKDYNRVRHPWSLFRVGPNARSDAPDFGCNNIRCSPNVSGDRVSFVYNIGQNKATHQIRGIKWDQSMVGTRILGKAFDNFDFTVNYLYKRADPAAFVIWDGAFDPSLPGTGALRPDFPIFLANDPAQRAQWFDTCMRRNQSSFLFGADAYGYNADGNPNNDRTGTFCLGTGHFYPWTHVIGFTVTYNDFNYTGAVFRLEQSWSTNEPRNFNVRNSPKLLTQNGEGQDEFGNPCPEGVLTCPNTKAFRKRSKTGSAVWRSMIGFDLLRSIQWLPGTFGRDQWFITGQHLLTMQNDNRPTALNPFTNAPFDRVQRWEQLFTLSGSGFFARGKLEPLLAYAYSPNGKQHLILLQSWWHGLYFRKLDLYTGLALYPGSKFDTDLSFLNYYTYRNTFWVRLVYYLL